MRSWRCRCCSQPARPWPRITSLAPMRWAIRCRMARRRAVELTGGSGPAEAPEIDGKVFINDFGPHEELVPGTFYRAEITESHDYDVVAKILE